jgi:hypothetical protein
MLQNRSLPHVEYFTWIFAGHFFAFSPSRSMRTATASNGCTMRDGSGGNDLLTPRATSRR